MFHLRTIQRDYLLHYYSHFYLCPIFQGTRGGPTLRPLSLFVALTGLSRGAHIRATRDCDVTTDDGGLRFGGRPYFVCYNINKQLSFSAPPQGTETVVSVLIAIFLI